MHGCVRVGRACVQGPLAVSPGWLDVQITNRLINQVGAAAMLACRCHAAAMALRCCGAQAGRCAVCCGARRPWTACRARLRTHIQSVRMKAAMHACM